MVFEWILVDFSGFWWILVDFEWILHDSDVERSKKCGFCLQKSYFLGSGRYPKDVAEVPAGTNRPLRVKLGF